MTEANFISKGQSILPFYIPQKTKLNLDILLNDVKNSEMDLVIVIDGPEGTGKSRTARGVGRYCATKLNGDCYTFGPQDITFEVGTYIEGSLKAGKPKDRGGLHKINVLDEGRNVLFKRRGMSKETVRFTNYISECRDAQQVHIICVPAFHDLDNYIILWRMAFIIHMKKKHEEDDTSEVGVSLKRGYYDLYTNRQQIKWCYYHPYKYPREWEDRQLWTAQEPFHPFEVKEYLRMKEAAKQRKYAEEEPKKKKYKKAEEESI